MSKKILGSIGLVVGLGLTLLLLYVLFQDGMEKPPSPGPQEQPQVAVRLVPEPTQKPGVPAPQPSVPPEPTPPVPGPDASPAVVPVPTPTPAPPPEEKKIAPSPPLEPKKEHGLLIGRFRHYKDANRVLEKTQKQKMPALIRKEGKYYKVWAGPFPTPQEAEQARKSLRAALKISPQKGKLEIPVAK